MFGADTLFQARSSDWMQMKTIARYIFINKIQSEPSLFGWSNQYSKIQSCNIGDKFCTFFKLNRTNQPVDQVSALQNLDLHFLV